MAKQRNENQWLNAILDIDDSRDLPIQEWLEDYHSDPPSPAEIARARELFCGVAHDVDEALLDQAVMRVKRWADRFGERRFSRLGIPLDVLQALQTIRETLLVSLPGRLFIQWARARAIGARLDVNVLAVLAIDTLHLLEVRAGRAGIADGDKEELTLQYNDQYLHLQQTVVTSAFSLVIFTSGTPPVLVVSLREPVEASVRVSIATVQSAPSVPDFDLSPQNPTCKLVNLTPADILSITLTTLEKS